MLNNQSSGQPISWTVNPRLDAALQSSWEAWEETARATGVPGVLAWLRARLELEPDGGDIAGPLADLLSEADPEDRTIARVELAELLQGEDDPLSETLWEGVLAYGLETSEADYIFEASSHLAAIAEEYADPLAAAEYFIDFLNWRRQPEHHGESEQVEVAFEEIIRLAELDGDQRTAALYANRQAQFNRLDEADDERAATGDWESNPVPYRSWE
jgi:hypothetical protein